MKSSLRSMSLPLACPVGKEAISRFKAAGFYGSTIARYTGLSIGQVRYRLGKYGLVVPRAFARGDDPKAQSLVQQARSLIQKIEQAKQKALDEKEREHLESAGRHD